VPLPWLNGLGCSLAALALVGVVHALSRDRGIRMRVASYREALERDLRVLQLQPTGADVVRGQALLTLGAAALSLAFATAWPLIGGGFALLVPACWLRYARKRRSARIAEQIDTGLVAIANALESGSSLGEALDSAARVLPAPLSQELTLILREADLGVPLDVALGDCARRVERPTVSAALVTLQVARNTGGDVIQTLQTCAESLRELTRLEGVVRSKTAEARAQAFVIAIIPLPMLYLLDALDSEFLSPVWNTTSGHLVLAVATALWAGAVLLAREILDVDV
jgi:tight adherence protein B